MVGKLLGEETGDPDYWSCYVLILPDPYQLLIVRIQIRMPILLFSSLAFKITKKSPDIFASWEPPKKSRIRIKSVKTDIFSNAVP